MRKRLFHFEWIEGGWNWSYGYSRKGAVRNAEALCPGYKVDLSTLRTIYDEDAYFERLYRTSM